MQGSGKKLNRIVFVLIVGSAQNDQGGNEPGGVEIDRWKKWAHVEDRSGSNSNQYQQQVWEYDYKITMRHERTRPTQSNYEISYGGYRLKINSVSIETEAFQAFEVCRCSKIDEVVTNNASS